MTTYEKRKAKLAEARAILDKADAETRGLSAEELTQHDALLAEAESLTGLMERQARLTAEEGRTGAPPSQAPAPTTEEEQRHEIEVLTPSYETGDAIGALVRARHNFGSDTEAAKKWASRTYGSGSKQFRAMQQSVFTAGGATIAENFVGAELIELLRATSAVRRAGARMLPLVNGSATLPKITGGATASWGVEGDNIAPSELTTGQIVLTEKKLTALVPVSNDLLKNGNLQTDRLIRDDMVRAAANTEDIAFLKGDGLLGKPKGVYYWVPAAGKGNSAGTALANIRTDIKTAKNRLGNANAPEVRRAWFMHSRDINYIGTTVVDANSNLVWPQMADGNGAKWNGGTVYQDNNIAITLGGGANASEVYYVEMSECFIGDSQALELELFANATYADAAGTLRSGISRDESVVRLIRKTDFAMRHIESAFVLEAVTYGA